MSQPNRRAGHDAQPVMVPRNDKAIVPTSWTRVRRLREHLVKVMRDLRAMEDPAGSASPLRPAPDGFAGRVAVAACSLCEGHCCRHGGNKAFLDDRTMARVRLARPDIDARAVLRLFVDRVPEAGYEGSCIFHGPRGCTLDRSLRSDVCNIYYCGDLRAYLASGDAASPVVVIAGEGDKARTSPVLVP